MTEFYIVLGIVVALIAALFVFISTRPVSFRVEQSAKIDAPCDVVFAIVNDLRKWGQWSPYDKHDPNMKKAFEGPTAGPGAIYSWNGNNQVGKGRLTILESKANEQVSMRLEFVRPFRCCNKVTFTLVPSEGGTQFHWIMDGKNNFMGKVMSLIVNMDKMVGKEFEHGLANLNTVAQAASTKAHESTSALAGPLLTSKP